MQEIFPGVLHWTVFRETIDAEVSSSWLRPAGVVLDPMVPDGGFDAFDAADVGPQQVVLTSGLHARDAQRFAERFGIPIRAPREAAERLGDSMRFEPYTDHEEIAPGIQAIHVGVLCPDEYALHITATEPAIAFADALHRYGDALSFFSDELLGDDASAIKQGLLQQLQSLLQRDFEHLLFAHGAPLVGKGKSALRDFVTSAVGHEDFGQAL